MAIVLIIASVVVSYLYSRELYLVYLDAYYTHVKEMTQKDMETRLEKLYEGGKIEQMEPLIQHARTLYPGNSHIRLLYGFYLMETDRVEDGIGVILTTGKGIQRFDEFLRVVEVLDANGMYADVISYIEGQSRFSNSYLYFYHGKAYYHQGRYREARENLRRAGDGGYDKYNLYYYLGLTEEKDGYPKKALEYMQKAYDMNGLDRDVLKALVRLYRKNDMYEKAGEMGKRLMVNSLWFMVDGLWVVGCGLWTG